MILPQQTVTAELRKWRRKRVAGSEAVEGYIYADVNQIWEDGDLALIYPIVEWIESANFWLARTNTAVYKCSKDEEIKNEAFKP